MAAEDTLSTTGTSVPQSSNDDQTRSQNPSPAKKLYDQIDATILAACRPAMQRALTSGDASKPPSQACQDLCDSIEPMYRFSGFLEPKVASQRTTVGEQPVVKCKATIPVVITVPWHSQYQYRMGVDEASQNSDDARGTEDTAAVQDAAVQEARQRLESFALSEDSKATFNARGREYPHICRCSLTLTDGLVSSLAKETAHQADGWETFAPGENGLKLALRDAGKDGIVLASLLHSGSDPSDFQTIELDAEWIGAVGPRTVDSVPGSCVSM